MNAVRYIAAAILLGIVAAMLFGCGATMQTVKVPVPVSCQEKEPDRPVMPTESPGLRAGLDAFVQAATAEIERRQGYEDKLLAALRACIAPIAP
jgi:hypothetical protein